MHQTLCQVFDFHFLLIPPATCGIDSIITLSLQTRKPRLEKVSNPSEVSELISGHASIQADSLSHYPPSGKEGYVFMFIVSLKSKPPGKPTFGVLSRIHRPHRAFGGGGRAGWDIIRACGHQAPAALDLGALAFRPPPPSLQTPEPPSQCPLGSEGSLLPSSPSPSPPTPVQAKNTWKSPQGSGWNGRRGRARGGGWSARAAHTCF